MEAATELSLTVLKKRGLLDKAAQIIQPQEHHLAKPDQAICDASTWFFSQIKPNSKKVLVIGDYDVDGVSATTVIYKLLNHLQIPSKLHIPTRDDGYGVRVSTIDILNPEDFSGVLIVDSGSNAIEVQKELNKWGRPILILDHHTVSAELPDLSNVKVVNPHIYKGSEQCSASLALQLCMTIPSFDHREAMGLAAMATLTDCMPLSLRNHSLVKLGLPYIALNKGLDLLIKSNNWGFPNQDIINWRVGPRLNAPGRMTNAQLALDLLCETADNQLQKIITQLEELNTERRSVQEAVLSEALPLAQNQENIILVKGQWHPGVVGIVASRLAEQYKLPTIVLGMDEFEYRGSGRTTPNKSLIDILNLANLKEVHYGGHSEAIGISFQQDKLEYVESNIRKAAAQYIGSKPLEIYDCKIQLEDINREQSYALEQLKPYGNGFPEPVFLTFGTLTKEEDRTYLENSNKKIQFITSTTDLTRKKHLISIQMDYSGAIVAVDKT